MSASAVLVSQSLVGFEPGGISPVQVTVRVCPVLVGTVTDWASGVAARAAETGSPSAPRATTETVTRDRRIVRSSAATSPPGGRHGRPRRLEPHVENPSDWPAPAG